MIGICSPKFEPVTNTGGAHYGTADYTYNACNGSLYHDAVAKLLQAKAMAWDGFESSNLGACIRWKGSQKAKQGDKLDLRLDFEKGTLSLIKNGQTLGILAGPSTVNPTAPRYEAIADMSHPALTHTQIRQSHLISGSVMNLARDPLSTKLSALVGKSLD